jgi:hypothetical protein
MLQARHLAASGDDGLVRVYLLRIDDLVALARSRVTRPLTVDECGEYLGASSCPDEK